MDNKTYIDTGKLRDHAEYINKNWYTANSKDKSLMFLKLSRLAFDQFKDYGSAPAMFGSILQEHFSLELVDEMLKHSKNIKVIK